MVTFDHISIQKLFYVKETYILGSYARWLINEGFGEVQKAYSFRVSFTLNPHHPPQCPKLFAPPAVSVSFELTMNQGPGTIWCNSQQIQIAHKKISTQIWVDKQPQTYLIRKFAVLPILCKRPSDSYWRVKLGRSSEKQIGNSKWNFPWKGGSRFPLRLFLLFFLLKNYLESLPDC